MLFLISAIGRRFGTGNETFFSCALIIFTILNAGIWLNALGVFSSAVFEANINMAIILIGVTVIFISVLAGAWGVVASDFVQTLTVAVVSVACAIVALFKVGVHHGPEHELRTAIGGDIRIFSRQAARNYHEHARLLSLPECERL